MIDSLIKAFSNRNLVDFFRNRNSSFVDYKEDLSDIVSTFEQFDNLIKLGEIEYDNTDKLTVFTCEYQGELTSRDSKKVQYEIAKKVLKENFQDGAVFVFYDQVGRFRFSFIRRNYGDKNQKYTPWKRYTYFVEPDATTNRTFKERIGTCKFDSLDNIQLAFSVEKLTKDFYKELSDWYFWAIKNVSFPNDVADDSDDEKFNSENIIRLITRLIFVWFLKQKGLIKNELFDQESLTRILKDFDPESETHNNYYRAILQNLFFATLNQEIGKRGFAEDKGYVFNRDNYTIKTLYRYEKEFNNSTTQIMELFSQVPFLNGGLFECLDRKEKDGRVYDWDGFSRNMKFQARIPNALFFAKARKVDLSKEYNDKRMKAVNVAGIIEILNRYNFTVEENTPVEVEVALDPELLGKVFENLLGAFNPETQETARKQTGSFYTPREIVQYMVDENLIAYFQTKVTDIKEETLRLLVSYDDREVEIDEIRKEAIIQAAFDCKILDPACGSGAFPMGVLQQMVHILRKLDPKNDYWYNVVMAQAMKDFEKSVTLSNDEKDQRLVEIEKTFDDGLNDPDYARKLHLIENCIYGVDIQSIAVQISKLRFFISLVCEQEHNTDQTENFGIRPLPNLETKFVAANSLIGLKKTREDFELFNDDHIKNLIDKLQLVRHRQFLVTNASEKVRLRKEDDKLRKDIENEITYLFKKHADDQLEKYKIELVLAEKEFSLLNKMPDDIRNTIFTDLFGIEKTTAFNFTESKRKDLKARIKNLNDKIDRGSDYSRQDSIVTLAKQLTSWNPYDQNQSSPFFDPEWMFGLQSMDNGYFNIVIGNPPFGAKFTKEEKDLFKIIFNHQDYQPESFLFFTEKGINLLKNNFFLSFIIPNTWLTNLKLQKIRRFLTSENSILNVSHYHKSVFDAVVDTEVVIFKKGFTNNNQVNIYIHKSPDKIEKIQHNQNLWKDKNGEVINIFSNEKIESLISKLRINTLRLSECADVFAGLVPYEEGKGNPPQTREMMKKKVYNSDVKLDNSYRAAIRGSDIKKYVNNWDGNRWLKYGNNLAAPRKSYIFDNPKIIIRQTGDSLIATYDEKKFVCFKNTHVINQKDNSYDLKYLLAIINSNLMNYYFQYLNPEIGEALAEVKKENVEKLLILKAENQLSFINIVELILKLKSEGYYLESEKLEQKLDNLVCRLYNLTYSEVKMIDPDIESKLSEVAYNAIEI